MQKNADMQSGLCEILKLLYILMNLKWIWPSMISHLEESQWE